MVMPVWRSLRSSLLIAAITVAFQLPAPAAAEPDPPASLPPFVEAGLDGSGVLLAHPEDTQTYILKALGQSDWYGRMLRKPGPHSVAISTRTMQIAGTWGSQSSIERAMAACGGEARGCRPYLDAGRVVWRPQRDDPVPLELVPPPRPDADTATPEGALSGSVADQASCARTIDAIWVEAGAASACLRYRHGRLARRNPAALLFLDGDEVFALLAQERRGISGIAAVTLAQRKRSAVTDPRWRALANRTDLPFIILARPGTGGSSGNQWRDGKTVLETALLDRALDVLAQRYGIERWALAGQSGGAAMAANLLARRRDIGCAALSSGPLALKAQYAGQGAADDLLQLLDDPLDHVARIAPDPSRRVFVVSDELDSLVPLRMQRPWVEAALSRGLAVEQVVGRGWGGGPQHHVLAWQAVRAATLCMHGLPSRAITDMLAAEADGARPSGWRTADIRM